MWKYWFTLEHFRHFVFFLRVCVGVSVCLFCAVWWTVLNISGWRMFSCSPCIVCCVYDDLHVFSWDLSRYSEVKAFHRSEYEGEWGYDEMQMRCWGKAVCGWLSLRLRIFLEVVEVTVENGLLRWICSNRHNFGSENLFCSLQERSIYPTETCSACPTTRN